MSFRNLPKARGSRVLRYLYRCQPVQILREGIRGSYLTWTQVKYGRQMGYVASQYVKKGSCTR